MIIYGAGMAGLLAAHVLRRHKPVIHEIQSSLPNNHEALLRFRTDAVARATGIPFKKVQVDKAVIYKGPFVLPTVKLNNLYSAKVTGEYHQRSIGNLESVERYVAPADFISQMARTCEIAYNAEFSEGGLDRGEDDNPLISTIPMPGLMKIACWQNKPEFKFRSIWSATFDVIEPKVALYQTIYFPDPDEPWYRVSITGCRITIELIRAVPPGLAMEELKQRFLNTFGIDARITSSVSVKEQKYGKLLPIDDAERRRFILAMTDLYRIYSVGRFATWRQILMDDVVKDLAKVEDWIVDRSAYARKLSQV